MTDWQLTGAVAAAGLAGTRRETHAAAQVVAAAGRSQLAPRADDSHTSLSWADAVTGFVGEALPPHGVRAGLQIATLLLCVVDAENRPLDQLHLEGRTLADARHWLAQALTGRVNPLHPVPPIQLPDRLAAERRADAPFVKHVEAAELANYYANANQLLARWASASSPVRTWPHHFDIAVLLTGPKEGQTVGAGLSPGDDSYGEPYWYVTPWPYPSAIGLPVLGGGAAWHTNEWLGAVLPASQIGHRDPASQRAQVVAFVESAVVASRAALDRSLRR